MNKAKKPPKYPVPPLVIEYHYNDGDVGAHPGDAIEKEIFEGFSHDPGHEPTHIILRADTPEGQELSTVLHEAAIEFHKKRYLEKIKDAEEVLNKLENNGKVSHS